MSQLELELAGQAKGSRPYRLPAPRHPFIMPAVLDDAAGYVDPEGRSWCLECASVSVYWRAKGRRLPKGWTRIPARPRAKVVPACERCEDPIR